MKLKKDAEEEEERLVEDGREMVGCWGRGDGGVDALGCCQGLYGIFGPVWKGGLCKVLKPPHYHQDGEVQYAGELLQLPAQRCPPTDTLLHNEPPSGLWVLLRVEAGGASTLTAWRTAPVLLRWGTDADQWSLFLVPLRWERHQFKYISLDSHEAFKTSSHDERQKPPAESNRIQRCSV